MLAFAALTSAMLCNGLICLLLPLLRRIMAAAPNERSSHRKTTPQGGGVAVVAATLTVVGAGVATAGDAGESLPALAAVAMATILLAVLGAVDDMRPLAVLPRLLVQAISVMIVAVPLAVERNLSGGAVPITVETAIVVLAGLWFINLTNFMDGIDWLTVAAMTPITAALACFGLAGFVDFTTMIVAAALFGALVGFAPFNRPVAKLFLGDVGALPIGLLVGWMLYSLAVSGGLPAALVLPLYSVTDASVTVILRTARGQRPWQAHRSHFYQRATANGLSVRQVSAHVFLLNCALAGLAGAMLVWPTNSVRVAAVVLAILFVALSLWRFSRPARASVRA
jgi:UDP-N-acetylmuramyl pentapeptide phosphotransferase/UDP-N-acetylglucosamine-1-phosphate transferase